MPEMGAGGDKKNEEKKKGGPQSSWQKKKGIPYEKGGDASTENPSPGDNGREQEGNETRNNRRRYNFEHVITSITKLCKKVSRTLPAWSTRARSDESAAATCLWTRRNGKKGQENDNLRPSTTDEGTRDTGKRKWRRIARVGSNKRGGALPVDDTR